MLGVNSNLCSLSLVLPWLPLPAVMTRIRVSEVHIRQPFLRSRSPSAAWFQVARGSMYPEGKKAQDGA